MILKIQVLREKRLQKGFSQEYMALAIEISQAHYSRIERGERKVDIETLGKILQILDLDIQEIVVAEPE
ncbi:MAG: helix-turn-helix transcriptional regulator [Cruoricaptor ignavus]|nr:helix-turn-helix transcriptional regulator [Cruoricaptor ignavus]